MADERPVRIAWSPRGNRAQVRLLACPVFEVFFGGARGGGKTDGVLGEFGAHASRYGKDAIGLMVRRTRAELVETIERSRAIYGPLEWTIQRKRERCGGRRTELGCGSPTSSAMLMRISTRATATREFTLRKPATSPILLQFSSLWRHCGLEQAFLSGYGQRETQAGPGHQWIKARYIDPAPLGNRIIRDPLTGLERVFIPSKVDNNQHIDVEAYKQRLRASGSQELVRAWLDGDWSVTMGAFFDCWEAKRHVVAPFAIPEDWMRFRSMDWGSASPFSVGWWAIVQDDYRCASGVLPRGCMVRYREWYGMRPGEPNVGLKLHAEEVGKGIAEREQGESIAYGVLDPSAFKEDGGPSIAERIARGSGGKVWFRHADNTRIRARGAMGGWDQLRARLVGDADGRPMLVVFSTCIDFIRTVPFLQHDPDRPEDVMTDSEDHVGDEVRYACMSRPWVPVKEAPKPENISGYRPYRTDEQPGDWLTY